MLEFEVIVVGAGPVGMTAAALLGHAGVNTIVLEQNAGVCEHPRAQTIDDESLRTMQALGITEEFLPTLLTAAGSRYYDANRECFAEVGPGPENYGYPKRNYMLQQKLDALLHRCLDNSPNIDVRFNTQVTGFSQDVDSIEVTTANGDRIKAQILLACDGGQSGLRNQADITISGLTYEKAWIVLDAVNDPDDDPVSRFYCDPARPHVSIASPGGGRRYEFMLCDGETAETVLTDAFLATLLAPYRTWRSEDITRRAVYTFHSRIADQLQLGRLLLLGDAAHLSPPFAGQGMNSGIRDAHNVAWKVASIIRNGCKLELLETFEAERREPIRAMIQLAVAMGEFVMPVGDDQVALTHSLLQALERFPEARDWIFQMRFKPKPRYAAGAFVDLDTQSLEASLVGEMLPQPDIFQFDGNQERLDTLLGIGFALLAQNDSSEACFTALDHPVWAQLSPRCVRLHATSDEFSRLAANGPEISRAVLPASSYARPLRTHRDQLVLVRPDRYVAGAFFPNELKSFSEKLNRVLNDGSISEK